MYARLQVTCSDVPEHLFNLRMLFGNPKKAMDNHIRNSVDVLIMAPSLTTTMREALLQPTWLFKDGLAQELH